MNNSCAKKNLANCSFSSLPRGGCHAEREQMGGDRGKRGGLTKTQTKTMDGSRQAARMQHQRAQNQARGHVPES